MATQSEKPSEIIETRIPSFGLETASELSKLRTTFPTSKSLFSSIDAEPLNLDKARVFFSRDCSTPSLLIEQSLKRAGYSVTGVDDSDRLFDACQSGAADIVVIDHSLPLTDRLTLLKKIVRDRPTLPVILVMQSEEDVTSFVEIISETIKFVIKDRDGAHLFKIPDIADQLIKEHSIAIKAQKLTPSVPNDEITEKVDLAILAEDVKGAIVKSQRPSLVVIAGPDAGLLVHLNNSKFIVGRDPTCHIHLKDESISRFHASIKSSSKGYLIIQDLNSTNGTFINGKRIHRRRLKEGDKILFGQNTLIRFEKQDAIDENYYDELYFSSTRDALTGIYNRRFCLEKFNTELSYARRHQLPVSLIMFDIDLFKKVNDTYGHPTGDRVLSTLATAVSATVRTEDTLGRYGGEEFIIFAMDTDMLGAQVFAERIRAKIAAEQIITKDESRRIIHVTVSIGVATTSAPFCYDAEKLIAAADANLYTAKAKGRNRVIASEVFE